MLTPYYEEPGIQIYHGDCREILPQLGPVDLMLTDPPYVGLQGGMVIDLWGGVAPRRSRTVTVGNVWSATWDWVPDAIKLARGGGFIFCSYHAVAELRLLLPKDSWLFTWHKSNSPLPARNIPHLTSEFAWAFRGSEPILDWRAVQTVISLPLLQAGCFATERLVDGSGASIHPTQKPVRLMTRLLAVGGHIVLDPFMGLGTTLVAAKRLGRKAIGIEIEEKYCEIAVRRVQEASLPLLEQAEPIQGGLEL